MFEINEWMYSLLTTVSVIFSKKREKWSTNDTKYSILFQNESSMAHYRTKYTYLSGYILHSYIYILSFCLISNTLQLKKRHLNQRSAWNREEERGREERRREKAAGWLHQTENIYKLLPSSSGFLFLFLASSSCFLSAPTLSTLAFHPWFGRQWASL